MCSWYEPPILRTIDILILDSICLKFFRATSSSIMCSWYEIPIFRSMDILILDWSQPKIFSCEIRNFNLIFLCLNFLVYLCIRSTAHRRAMSSYLLECHVLVVKNGELQLAFLLVHEIFLSQNFLKRLCIRSTTHRRAISCHLLECHVLLIQNTKYRISKISDFVSWTHDHGRGGTIRPRLTLFSWCKSISKEIQARISRESEGEISDFVSGVHDHGIGGMIKPRLTMFSWYIGLSKKIRAQISREARSSVSMKLQTLYQEHMTIEEVAR